MDTFTVMAHWDAEASVWWAESDDLPGLMAEAASFDDLMFRASEVAADLLDMSATPMDGLTLQFVTSRPIRVPA